MLAFERIPDAVIDSTALSAPSFTPTKLKFPLFPSTWFCSLGLLGLCVDQAGDAPAFPLPNAIISCPDCSLPKSPTLNARDTKGLVFDTKELLPLLVPLVQQIKPLAHLIASYLRITAFEVGDCIEVPDWTGLVSRAVIIQKIERLPFEKAWANRNYSEEIQKLLDDLDQNISFVLVRFNGWSNGYDEIVPEYAIRPRTDIPVNPQQRFTTRVDMRISWQADDRWSAPSVIVSWTRCHWADRSDAYFVKKVCEGAVDTAHIRHKLSKVSEPSS